MANIKSSDRDYIDTGEPILRTKGLRWPPSDLCVHFVNTGEGREDTAGRYKRFRVGLVPQPLAGYDAIVRWMGLAGGLADDEVRQLLKISDAFPPDAIDVNTQLIEVRTLFQRIAGVLVARKWPSTADLETVRAMVHEYWPPLSFEWDDRGVWTCDPPEINVDWPRRQLAFSMVRLLTGRARHRVRRCQGKECTLLFVDSGTKGARRTYCDHRVCGERNRPKRSTRY